MNKYLDAAKQFVEANPDTPRLTSKYAEAARGVAQQPVRDAKINLETDRQPNPDAAGKANLLARATGIAPETAERQLPEVERDFDFKRTSLLLQQEPALAQWAANPRNAKIAPTWQDMFSMSEITRDLKAIRGQKALEDQAFAPKAGQRLFREGELRLRSMGASLTATAASFAGRLIWPTLGDNAVVREAQAQARYLDAEADKIRVQNPGSNFVSEAILQGFSSVPTSAYSLLLGGTGGIAAGATRGAVASSGAMGTLTGAQSYQEGIAAGLDPIAATRFAVTQGGTDAVLEYVPGLKLLENLSIGTPFVRTLLTNMTQEALTEGATQVLQSFDRTVTLDPTKPLGEWLQEQPAEVLQAMIAGAAGGGLVTSIVSGVDAAFRAMPEDPEAARMEQAQAEAETLGKLLERAAENPVRERDPVAFAEYLQSQTDGTPVETIYVPAEKVLEFYQSQGIEPGAADDPFFGWLEGFGRQLQQAAVSNGDIAIPTAGFAANLAGSPVWEALKDDMRLSADGLSVNEAKALKETEQARKELDRAAKGQRLAEVAAEVAPVAAIYTAETAKLRGAGFTPQQAKANALLVAERYRARGAALGIDLMELYRQDNVTVERVLGDTVLRAERPETEAEQNQQPTEAGNRPEIGQKPPEFDLAKARAEREGQETTPTPEPAAQEPGGRDAYLAAERENAAQREREILEAVAKIERGEARRIDRDAMLAAVDDRARSRTRANMATLLGEIPVETIDPAEVQAASTERLATLEGEVDALVANEISANDLSPDAAAYVEAVAQDAELTPQDHLTEAVLAEAETADPVPEGAVLRRAILGVFTAAETTFPGRNVGWTSAKREAFRAGAEDGVMGRNFPDEAVQHHGWRFVPEKQRTADGRKTIVEAYRAGQRFGEAKRAEMARKFGQYQKAMQGEFPDGMLDKAESLLRDLPAELPEPDPGGGTPLRNQVYAALNQFERTIADDFQLFGKRPTTPLYDKWRAWHEASTDAERAAYQQANERRADAERKRRTSFVDLDDGQGSFPLKKGKENRARLVAMLRTQADALLASVMRVDAIEIVIKDEHPSYKQGYRDAYAGRRKLNAPAREAAKLDSDKYLRGYHDGLSMVENASAQIKGDPEVPGRAVLHFRRTKWQVWNTPIALRVVADNLEGLNVRTFRQRDRKAAGWTVETAQAALAQVGIDGAIVTSVGPLGPVIEGLESRWADAVKALRALQTGDVRGALSHPAVGAIDVLWGEPGTSKSDGYGLSKLERFHPDVIDDLPNLLAGMAVDVGRTTRRRVQLESANHRAGIRLQYDGESKTWLLTAFKKDEASGQADDTLAGAEGREGSPDPEAGSDIPLAPPSFNQSTRGNIRLTDSGSIIQLHADANESTYIHELGHLWLEQLRADVQRPDAPQWLKDDFATVQAWFAENGLPVGPDGTVPVAAHELWARGVERYMMEGKAPSLSLRKVFERFTGWLTNIYRNVLALNSPITPEIRRVMDRMLSVEDAAAKALADGQFTLLPQDQLGMTDEAYAALKASAAEAVGDARANLLNKAMTQIRVRQQAAYRAERDELRAKVQAEVDADPMMRAYHLLLTGAWLGEPDRQPERVRFSRDLLTAAHGAEAPSLLPRSVPPMVDDEKKPDGLHPDEIAEMVGIASGDELVRGLMAIRQEQIAMRERGDKRGYRTAQIENRVDAEMDSRHAELLNEEAIMAEAKAVLANEKMGEVLAAELRAITRSTGTPGATPTPFVYVRAWAREQVRQGNGREALSSKAQAGHARAAAKAGREAFDLLQKGDREGAALAKQRQMVAHALHMEAKEAHEDAKAAHKRLKQLARRTKAGSIDITWFDKIHEMLEAYGLKDARDDRDGPGYVEWLLAQAASGAEIALPPGMGGFTVPQWDTLTVNELIALADTVNSLAHIGRQLRKIEVARQEQELDDFLTEAEEAADKRPDIKRTNDFNQPKSVRREIVGGGLKLEYLFDELDGGDPNGPMNRLFVQGATAAANTRSRLQEQVLKPIAEAYLAMDKADHKRLGSKVTLDLIDQKTGERAVMTRMDMLSIALNMGNASNAAKLAGGFKTSEEAVMAALEPHMTKADWDFVQAVWNAIGTLKADIIRVERAMKGFTPEMIEPRPVITPFGVYDGGYYPVAYDRTRSTITDTDPGDEAEQFIKAIGPQVGTNSGFTISRTEVKAPILLQLEPVLFGHIRKVVNRIAYAEYLRDALKVANEPRFKKLVETKLGAEYGKLIRPWLRDQVLDGEIMLDGLGWMQKAMRRLRMGITFVGMAFRWGTMLAQTAGFTSTANRIGAEWMAKGLGEWMRHPIQAQRFVFERSEEMTRRAKEFDRDVREIYQSLLTANKSRLDRALAKIDKGMALGFWHIGMADRLVSVSGWLGAYRKGIAEGMTEEEAAAYGDKVVRQSQGTGRVKDLAEWQRPNNEFAKMATLFYSYFNVQFNEQWRAQRDARRGAIHAAAMNTFWMMIAAPLAGALLTGDMPTEDDGEDEAAAWAHWAMRHVFFGLFAGIPLVRDVAGAVKRKAGGQYADVGMTPLGRFFQAQWDLGEDIVALFDEDMEPSSRWVKHALEAPGYFLPLMPFSGQFATTAQFLWDVANDEQDPETAKDWYYGITKGRVPADS